MIEYLENTCPKVEWRIVLLERTLQPRIFLKDAKMRIIQTKVLVGDKPKGTTLRQILESLDLLIDTEIPGQAISNVGLMQLGKAVTQLEQHLRSGKDEKALSTILAEGMRKIYESLREKTPSPTEILFAVRPTSSIFYLEERRENLELILNVSVQDASLPISSFQVTCRIDDDPRLEISKLVSIHQASLVAGYIEPGSIKELSIFVDVDRSILTKYAAASFRFDFFDGIKALEPSDSKHVFQIAFRNSRPGSRFNPYIAGKAVDKGGLYIGREREIDSIKRTLMGQTQDNIPLILGIRRIGKTSLLKRLADDEEIKRKYVPVFFDLQDMPESETTADLFKRICEKIHKECGDKWKVPFNRSQFGTDPGEVFLTYLSGFTSAKGDKRVLIMFDECEKLSESYRIVIGLLSILIQEGMHE